MSIETIFEELKYKINKLNTVTLNSESIPSHFTAQQCLEMGLLTLELNAVINDLKASEATKSDLITALNSVNDIERKAEKITNG